MAGCTIQKSPSSGLCECDTEVTCWEDLAAGTCTAGLVHGCLQALRCRLVWKYRRKFISCVYYGRVICHLYDYSAAVSYWFSGNLNQIFWTSDRVLVFLACKALGNWNENDKFGGMHCPTGFWRYLHVFSVFHFVWIGTVLLFRILEVNLTKVIRSKRHYSIYPSCTSRSVKFVWARFRKKKKCVWPWFSPVAQVGRAGRRARPQLCAGCVKWLCQISNL